MGRSTSLVAEVIIEAEASRGEAELVQRVFEDRGVPAVVRAALGRKSENLLPWAMIVKAPLMAFLTALAARAGEDGWKALRGFVVATYEARKRPDRPDGAIRFDDQESRRTIILTDSIPEEGFQAIADERLPRTGYLLWDPEKKVWRQRP